MKKHYLLCEIIIFSLFFLFCIIPPIYYAFFLEEASQFTEWVFPLQQLLLFIFAFIFYKISYPGLVSAETKEKSKLALSSPSHFFIFRIFPSFFTLCLLFCSGLFFKFLAVLFNNSSNIKAALPQNFTAWIFCILNFFFSAFYEEIIYRFYNSDALCKILNYKWSGKIIKIICEVFGVLVFAFAHFYSGLFSVINAAIGHVILRICYKKTGSIYTGFTAHFLYNILALLFIN